MEIVIPAWASAVIVALIAILGHFAVQRYVLFRNACIKFRSSFASEVATLKRSEGNVYAIFRDSISRHAVAVEEFRPFVKRKVEYDQAWDKYKNTYSAITAHISEVDGFPKDHIHANPLKDIEHLLTFATYTLTHPLSGTPNGAPYVKR